ncbi:hypothetical protein ABH935_010075 [Catenulispora sp. GAS73]
MLWDMTAVESRPATPETPRKRRRRPTPWFLKAFTALAIAASVLFAVIAALGASNVRSGFNAIGTTEEPQVSAGNDLIYALNDMDANLANILMVGDKNLGPGVDRAAFTKLFEADRAEADHDLQLAALHAGASGPGAQQVADAFNALGDYEALAAQVMYVDTAGANRPAGQLPQAESAQYAQATDLMRSSVLPAAHAVADSNGAALESSYQNRRGVAQQAVWWIVLTGVLALTALVVFELWLTRRTRRTLSPALVGATVLTLIVMVWGALSMGSASEHLRAAKKDAYDSVAALSAAKAESTDANADESRLVVDPSRATQYQASFLAKSRALLDPGPNVTLATYDAAVKADLDAYFTNPSHPVDFGGYFGTEMKNITFPGEREAAERMLRTYQTYELDDRVFRQKLATDLPEAIRFDTSPAAADSDGAFTAYAAAVQKVIDINASAFTANINAGVDEVTLWQWLPLGACVLAIGLAVAGVRPRLAEYR